MDQKIVLRSYQQAAIEAAMAEDRHQLIVLPTGAGKSLVAACLLREAVARGKRCVLFTHRKELITQDALALAAVAPAVEYGIFSASLGRKEPEKGVVFAQVQSAVRALPVFGERRLVLVDEAHLIPRSLNTMYGAVLDHYREAQRIGLTATPYRLDSGRLDEGDDRLFDLISHQVLARDLVDDGYLSPLVGLVSIDAVDTTGVPVRMGDFVPGKLADALLDDRLIRLAADDIAQHFARRTALLVFCVTVDHAVAVCDALQERGIGSVVVHGAMPQTERDEALEALRSGRVRALVNVNVLTTGVDLPLVDTLAILRPTLSKGLHVQMLGRGMRLSPATGKKNCLVLDYARNCKRHGDIDEMGFEAYRDVPQEQREQREAADRKAREISHRGTADDDPFGQRKTMRVEVYDVAYEVWGAAKMPGKNNLVAVYHTSRGIVRQWICVEYDGYAAHHARRWFARRGLTMPASAAQARESLLRASPPMPESLTVDASERYLKVLTEHWSAQS